MTSVLTSRYFPLIIIITQSCNYKAEATSMSLNLKYFLEEHAPTPSSSSVLYMIHCFPFPTKNTVSNPVDIYMYSTVKPQKYMYMYIYIHLHVQHSLHVNVQCTCICIYMYMYMCVCVCVCTFECVCVCVYVFTLELVHVLVVSLTCLEDSPVPSDGIWDLISSAISFIATIPSLIKKEKTDIISNYMYMYMYMWRKVYIYALNVHVHL